VAQQLYSHIIVQRAVFSVDFEGDPLTIYGHRKIFIVNRPIKFWGDWQESVEECILYIRIYIYTFVDHRPLPLVLQRIPCTRDFLSLSHSTRTYTYIHTYKQPSLPRSLSLYIHLSPARMSQPLRLCEYSLCSGT